MTIEKYKELAFNEIVGLENFTGNSLPSIAHHLAVKYFKYHTNNSEMESITRGILILSENGISLDGLFGNNSKGVWCCDTIDVEDFTSRTLPRYDGIKYIINQSYLTKTFNKISDCIYETDFYFIHFNKLIDKRGNDV